MIEFGSTLRAAREAKGLTISQIAESTHMMASIVQDMENENFMKNANPCTGAGIWKNTLWGWCAKIGVIEGKQDGK